MSEKDVAYDEEYEEGITFKKIGHFFKTGWLRMIIYVVACVLLVTAVVLPIKVFYKSEPVAKTTVEFIYKGVDKGLAPDGSAFNANEIISVHVVSDAVEKAGLSDKVKDVSALRSAMRVEGVLTDEYIKLSQAAANGDTAAIEQLRTYNMIPTQFDIVLSDPSNHGLSDAQAAELLNQVFISYGEYFQKTYAVTQMFDVDLYKYSDSTALELTDIFDIYKQALEPIRDYLTLLQTEDAMFISAKYGKTFAGLLSELSARETAYDNFNSFLLANNVWRDKATAIKLLTENKTSTESSLENLKTYITALQAQISSIEPNTTTTPGASGTTTTIQYPSEYFVYQSRLDQANRDVLGYNNRLADIEQRLKKLNEDTSEVSAVNLKAAVDRLKELESESVKFVNDVNNTIEDYYNTKIIPNAVRKVRAPVVTRVGLGFSMLVVYVVAVVVGLLAGGIVTVVKINSARSRAVKNPPVENAENE